MVSHPETLIKAIAVVIVIALIPVLLLLFGFMFITQIPGTIAETTMSALGESVDEVVLDWEDFKAQLSNGIDDFLTWITTGEKAMHRKRIRMILRLLRMKFSNPTWEHQMLLLRF